MERPTEVRDYHTRLLKCSLEIEHCRAYWRNRPEADLSEMPQRAFADYWFGARSLPRVRLLLANFRQRFDRFPSALAILHRWDSMDATTRRLICHWHLQLADPLYREFTGTYLVDRAASGRLDVSRDPVVRWLETLVPARWATATRIQFARKLLHAATEAGLLKGNRDPRPLQPPRVTEEGLAYLLHLLRGIEFQGNLATNPYLASVGMTPPELERRLRTMSVCGLQRQGDLCEFVWNFDGLVEWAEATVLDNNIQLRGTA